MMGPIRRASILTACWLLVASAAIAQIPDPNVSELPRNPVTGRPAIYLGPYTLFPGPGLAPAAIGPGALFQFRIRVRTMFHEPIPFSIVRIDFSGCRGLFIAPNVDPMVNCAGQVVSRTADANGDANFAIIGASSNAAGAGNPQGFESSTLGCATVFAAEGGGGAFVSLGRLFVATPDQDNNPAGVPAITGADLSAMIGDVAFCAMPSAGCFPNCYLNRSDFDQDGNVDGADIARMLDLFVLTAAYNGPSCSFAGTCCPITP